jgi:23S rRNA pseudouridine2605 synthase
MPRDTDKRNDSPRDRRERPGGGKGRSGKPRGPDKKFAKRGFGPKKEFGGGRDGDRPRFRTERDERRPARFDRDEQRPKRFDRDDRRPERFDRDDRPPRRDRDDRPPRRERDEGRSAGRFGDRKFAKRDGERDFKSRENRPFSGRREDRNFAGRDRGDEKPWRKRDDRRDDRRGDERPRFSRSRDDKPKFERSREERPKFGRPRWQRDGDSGERRDDKRFDRQRDRDSRDRGHDRERPQGRNDWQEHPRSERRFAERPRRDNEDDSKIFAKRPAFGGRGAYRDRRDDADRHETRDEPPRKKTGERIAKVLARAGLASRRDAEAMVVQGRVTVNGRLINSPALDVTANDVIAVDGEKLPPRERTRLFMYHKPRGLMTTHADPEGRPTVFDNLPEGLPRLISIGRLDFNTEGLLLLTNDGGLARVLELPETGWLRRYRVRAHGEATQAQLDELKAGVEVDGVKYGPIDATLERDQGANVWLVFAIREGKNREVRNVLAHLGLEVNRLIRVSYGPFQLGEIAEGAVEEVKTRVLREQLGEKVIARAGADFERGEAPPADERKIEEPRGKKPFKPSGKSALVSDRKGRRVLVQRTGGEEARARNELEANGYGPPRRPKRGYHGKRDLQPRDE